MKKRLPEYADLCNANPIFKGRLEGVGYLDLAGCLALGITGPVLRVDRLPVGPAQDPAVLRLRDLRLRRPDLGHLRRLRPLPRPARRDVGVAEDRRAGRRPAGQARGRAGDGRGQEDRLAGQLALGSDGMGNSLDHIRHIMGESMEALIHHFKLVTEGFRVPAGPGLRRRSSRRAASSASTSSPTAAPARTARTSATRRSPTCRPTQRCARAAWSPT